METVMTLISTYYSDDGTKTAEVYYNDDGRLYEVKYFEDETLLVTESYTDKSLQYHEDAAENYVMGIKKI
jgi:uncharacterized protein YkuJ